MTFYLLGYDPGTPQYTFPRRGGAKLSGTCIVHTAECARDDVGEDTSAEGTAKFIAERADYGSYHTLVDSDSIIEMVPYEYEAWQDSETNNWAVGISAALRTTDWGNMPADREERVYRNLAWAAADFVTYMRTKGIEVERKRISGADARARKPGFCAHGDSGISRSDPGVNFDWARFFRYTNEILDGDDLSLTDEQAKQLAYIASPEFKAHFWTGTAPVEVEARKAAFRELLATEVDWYGFDGNVPAEGRKTTTPAIQFGWLDTQNSTVYRIVEQNTNKVLDAVANIPGVDATVIAGLREELAAELKEATDNLKVTLVVEKDAATEEPAAEQ